MGRIKRICFWIGIGCLMVFFTVPFKAYAAVRTGGIKISLDCYEEISGQRIRLKRRPEMVPNEKTSYILSIKNDGADAWIRLLVDVVSDTEKYEKEVEEGELWLKGVGETWEKKGSYWYYKKPLKNGERVDFCQEVQIPDFCNLPDGMTFEIISKAEAIQADHVTPDFSSDNPFSGIYVEESVSNGEWNNQSEGFSVIYENGADTVLHTDRLFQNVDVLMPGDENEQVILVSNQNPHGIRILMREEGVAIDERLLKKLNLKIRREGTVIYDGPLADHAIKNGLALGDYESRTEEELSFLLSLAEDAGNDTAFQTIDLKIIFSVEAITEKDRDEESGPKEKKEENRVNMHPYPDPAKKQGYTGGYWKLINENDHVWEYYFADGSQAKDGWLYLYNPYSRDEDKNGWFCFDEKGTMLYGWIKIENDNWYFCHEISDGNLGRLKKGWHRDNDDQRTYYLDPITGIMQSGWREIDGNFYYFTRLEETYRQNWFWNTKVGRWIYDFLGYRTYGSMFVQEETPDGYQVGADGIWINK